MPLGQTDHVYILLPERCQGPERRALEASPSDGSWSSGGLDPSPGSALNPSEWKGGGLGGGGGRSGRSGYPVRVSVHQVDHMLYSRLPQTIGQDESSEESELE